jgi:hypothetical protein
MRWQRRLRLAAQAHALEAARRQFETSGNPLFAWDSYARARSDELPIPEWVLLYFDATARRLGGVVQQAQAGQPIARPGNKVAEAFGMKVTGSGSVFARFAGVWLDWDWAAIGSQVAGYIRQGDKESFAIENVFKDLTFADEEAQRRGLRRSLVPSASTIGRAWRRYKKELPSY